MAVVVTGVDWRRIFVLLHDVWSADEGSPEGAAAVSHYVATTGELIALRRESGRSNGGKVYGLVNKGIKDLIEQRHGTDMWQRVAGAAGCEDITFLSMEVYDDALTGRLVAAASEELGVAPTDLLEVFGEYWIKYTAAEGYGELMDLFGKSLREFLDNLDNMHARLGLSMQELLPPRFSFDELEEGKYLLHYESSRSGLAPMVVGLLRGLAQRFDTDVEVTHQRPGEQVDHDVFVIEERMAVGSDK